VFSRILAAVSPEWALRRALARLALDRISARYEGAANTRRTRSWQPGSAGPNAEVGTGLHTLRNRSRDLTRNNPYAAAALDLHASYAVGTGIMPRSNTGDAELDRQANALFAAWATAADYAGAGDLGSLQSLLARSRAESGEGMGMLVRLSSAEARRRGVAVPLAIQVFEPDLIDTAKDETFNDGTVIRNGIEVDGQGRVVAYWLFDQHPGERDFLGRMSIGASRRVPAAQVLHLFRADRPGQVRGVPDLAPVIARLRGLDELEDAALETAKVQACLAAFVTSDAPASRGPLEATDPDTGEQTKRFTPGMIERLRSGESVEFVMPSGNGPFAELARHQLHAIATGYGLTYDLLTGDLSQANYSSLRAGRLAFKRRLEMLQWLTIVPRICVPVWDAFIAAAQAAGQLPLRPGAWPVQWSVPRFEMVDPLKDGLATLRLVRSGFMTWPQAVGEMGWDPQQQLDEIAAWNRKLSDAGVILDSDPRRTAVSGGAQDAAQNAAVEIGAEGAASDPAEPDAAAAEMRAAMGEVVDAIRAMPAPVVQVAAPVVHAGAVYVDVHATIPKRGRVIKTVTGYDEQGRITGMSEEEADDEQG
jgi:lambda family phage portal protein